MSSAWPRAGSKTWLRPWARRPPANVQRLLKQADRVVFCFDRDEAGDRAAWRAMEVSLGTPGRQQGSRDPADARQSGPRRIVREHGREAFDGLITAGATRLSEYLVREVRKPVGASIDQQFNLATAEGRAQLVQEAKPLLQRISAPILRVQITKAVADLARGQRRPNSRPNAVSSRSRAAATRRRRPSNARHPRRSSASCSKYCCTSRNGRRACPGT
jgi:DNA primase